MGIQTKSLIILEGTYNLLTKSTAPSSRPQKAEPASARECGRRGDRLQLRRPKPLKKWVLQAGPLSNQGEKSTNFYFIMVPFKEKSIKVWYSKAHQGLGLLGSFRV